MPLREIAGPAGRLEALLDEPADAPRAAVVIGHPHPLQGGTMHTKAVYQAAKAFARIGCAALRFNFRGAGASGGSFSDGVGEKDDFRAALDFMHERYPNLPLWSGGMSFGSWIGMTAGAEHPDVSTLFGIAIPVTQYEWTAVERSTKAKFFIQGERDELCPLSAMRTFYARCAEPKELVVIDAADHLFDGKVSEVADAIEDLFGDWSG